VDKTSSSTMSVPTAIAIPAGSAATVAAPILEPQSVPVSAKFLARLPWQFDQGKAPPSLPPVQTTQMTPLPLPPPTPSIHGDPRSFYGELGNAGGKRVVPFTSNRGYSHYVSQPS